MRHEPLWRQQLPVQAGERSSKSRCSAAAAGRCISLFKPARQDAPASRRQPSAAPPSGSGAKGGLMLVVQHWPGRPLVAAAAVGGRSCKGRGSWQHRRMWPVARGASSGTRAMCATCERCKRALIFRRQGTWLLLAMCSSGVSLAASGARPRGANGLGGRSAGGSGGAHTGFREQPLALQAHTAALAACKGTAAWLFAASRPAWRPAPMRRRLSGREGGGVGRHRHFRGP